MTYPPARRITEVLIRLTEPKELQWARRYFDSDNRPTYVAQGALFLAASNERHWGEAYLWLADAPDDHPAVLMVELGMPDTMLMCVRVFTDVQYSQRLLTLIDYHGWYPELTFHVDKSRACDKGGERVRYVKELEAFAQAAAAQTTPKKTEERECPPAPKGPERKRSRYHLRSTAEHFEGEGAEGGAKE